MTSGELLAGIGNKNGVVNVDVRSQGFRLSLSAFSTVALPSGGRRTRAIARMPMQFLEESSPHSLPVGEAVSVRRAQSVRLSVPNKRVENCGEGSWLEAHARPAACRANAAGLTCPKKWPMADRRIDESSLTRQAERTNERPSSSRSGGQKTACLPNRNLRSQLFLAA